MGERGQTDDARRAVRASLPSGATPPVAVRRGGSAALALLAMLSAVTAVEPGCGTRKPTTDGMDASTAANPDAVVTPDPVGTPDALVAPDATDDAAALDASTAADAAETGPGTLPSRCRFDGPADTAQAILAVAVDGGVVLVMSDGSTRAVYQFTSTRPPSGTSFWIGLQPAGDDIFAVGTWWGGAIDPATPCQLIDGALACPETERWVRITRAGEVSSDLTQRSFKSSANIGSTSPPDADRGATGAPGTPVVPAAPDPATFTWIFPPGLTPMDRLIDSQGWFIAVLRDDYAAGVYRSPDAASSWTLLGKSLGQVETVSVRNTAGTYFIATLGTGSVFVPTQRWQSDAPAGRAAELLQDSIQLVRPETGVADVLSYGYEISVNLSVDGLCAVNWEPTPSGRQLTILDLTTNGAKHSFLFEKVGIGLPTSLWIENAN